MTEARPAWPAAWWPADALGAAALALMVLVPVIEIALRPLMGRGIDNAPVLVQHLGLWLAMAGAVGAARRGQLTTLGGHATDGHAAPAPGLMRRIAQGLSAIVCGLLAWASTQFVITEAQAARPLAYGLPLWWVQAVMPVGFALLGLGLGATALPRSGARASWLDALPGLLVGVALTAAGVELAPQLLDLGAPGWPLGLTLVLMLLAGAPVFAVLGALALGLFWAEGLPLASVALSHYQITVNPSLPALPLFTLAGLVLARTGAAARLSRLFVALFGGAARGTVLAVAVLCSVFTAFTGGSGVTILALGGLLLPLLQRSGYPERRGIGLVTSASALGVLLAPSVPMIMVAVIARVPIGDMFLAGVLPALVMVASLLIVGGFLRVGPDGRAGAAASGATPAIARASERAAAPPLWATAWAARWELLAPLVALGSLLGGLATPTESAALTAAYVLLTQALLHRELGTRDVGRALGDCARLIGGVMLILGMALALTNYLVDAGVPDAAIEWTRAHLPDRRLFLLALVGVLAVSAALMEIFAAIVVLVPLLLPVAISYGIEPLHFGVIFLAAMELGFLCPPAGLNIYFAAAMFGKSVREVAAPVAPAVLAILVGTGLIAAVPVLSTGLPRWLGSG